MQKFTKGRCLDFIDDTIELYPKYRAVLKLIRSRVELVNSLEM